MAKQFIDSRGQAGSVFKILIGAVVGLAIVGIIYSIIVMMGTQKTYLSEEVFSNKILMAMKNPIGTEYVINDFSLEKGKAISKKALSEETGLGTSCITLSTDEAIKVNLENPNENYIAFKDTFVVDVGVTCNPINDDSQCQIKCDLNVYDRGYKN